jgi:hypothetical protein
MARTGLPELERPQHVRPHQARRRNHPGGGQIHKVVYDVADNAYIDVERHLVAAIVRD